jgi:hypothetical protein
LFVLLLRPAPAAVELLLLRHRFLLLCLGPEKFEVLVLLLRPVPAAAELLLLRLHLGPAVPNGLLLLLLHRLSLAFPELLVPLLRPESALELLVQLLLPAPAAVEGLLLLRLSLAAPEGLVLLLLPAPAAVEVLPLRLL